MKKIDNHQKIIAWLDHCHVQAIWRLWRIVQREGCRLRKIHYFGKCSRLALLFSRILFFTEKNFVVEKFASNLYVHNHDDQEALYWDIWRDRFHFGWQTGQAAGFDYLTEPLAKDYNRFSLELYLRRQIAYDQMHPMGLIRLVDWNIKNNNLKDENHIVLLSDAVWEQSLKEYAASFNLRLYPFNDKNYILWSLIRVAYSLFKCVKFYGRYLFSRFSSSKKTSASETFSPKIGVFYAQGGELSKRSDLYWLPFSGLAPQDVLVYFMSPHYLPTKERIDSLEKLGVQWFSLLPQKFNGAPNSPERTRRYCLFYSQRLWLALKGLMRLCKEMKISSGLSKWWQYEKLVWLLDRIAQFEALFLSQNIKVHFGLFSEDDQNMMAINMAVERVNAVDVYAHWSNHPEVQMLPAHDVYFSWGPYFRRFYDPIGHGIRYLFYGGYIFDHTFEATREEARLFRQQLNAKGATFVISFFDNAYLPGWGWFSRQSMIEFYDQLLQKLIQHPEWGLIIKPKREKSFTDGLSPQVRQMLTELIEEGRCLVLDFKKFPSLAAQASDVAIGFGVFNTPSIETSLAGVKTITYDPSHQRSHPFYKEGYNKIVFDDLDTMTKSIEQYVQNPEKVSDFGDFSAYLATIDPFQDKRAALRIGECIKNLFNQMAQGSDRKEALQSVARLYRGKYGAENVVEYSQADFDAFLSGKGIQPKEDDKNLILEGKVH